MINERVLITGGAGGIGAAIAERCRREGLEVITADRLGGDIEVDLTDVEATTGALHECLEDGPITRLVNNVGAVFPGPVDEQSHGRMTAAWDLNVRTALTCLQPLLPGMKAEGFGRVVNISSRAALGKELRTAYAATKAAQIGLTRVWALELGKHGITVNAIAPGPIATELFEQANPPGSARTRAILDSVPVGRVGRPEDIAHSAAHLLDERSGFVTGQTLFVCGGITVGLSG
ncbi:SDR family oxidoreductase [Nocardiopsis salina]|uniref:SDR family oxidoreductase n=1 Tax=Nocardiopsis salina TaxID=245836 RepID=UPI00034D8DF6|nr:SDR family oxidoreductase [Nocardiopsis salina]